MPVHFRIKHTRHTYLIRKHTRPRPDVHRGAAGRDRGDGGRGGGELLLRTPGRAQLGRRQPGNFNPGSTTGPTASGGARLGVLWMQLESVASVTAARHLAKPGVDCLSFGPMDLTISLEAHPGHPFKTVDDCVQHTVDQLRGSGTAVCFRIPDAEERQKYIDMGVTVLLESSSLRGAR